MKKRLFIGLPMTDEAKRGVRNVMRMLYKKHWQVRWEPEEKWHMTLLFLGHIESADELVSVTQKISIDEKPIELGFNGLGQFPRVSTKLVRERVHGRIAKPVKVLPPVNLALPTVVWLGIKGDLFRLHHIQKTLRRNLEVVGYSPEAQAFYPHITLGRVNVDASYAHKVAIAKEIGKMQVLDIPHSWLIDTINLYESVLKPEGSEYRIMGKIGLQ